MNRHSNNHLIKFLRELNALTQYDGIKYLNALLNEYRREKSTISTLDLSLYYKPLDVIVTYLEGIKPELGSEIDCGFNELSEKVVHVINGIIKPYIDSVVILLHIEEIQRDEIEAYTKVIEWFEKVHSSVDKLFMSHVTKTVFEKQEFAVKQAREILDFYSCNFLLPINGMFTVETIELNFDGEQSQNDIQENPLLKYKRLSLSDNEIHFYNALMPGESSTDKGLFYHIKTCSTTKVDAFSTSYLLEKGKETPGITLRVPNVKDGFPKDIELTFILSERVTYKVRAVGEKKLSKPNHDYNENLERFVDLSTMRDKKERDKFDDGLPF